MTEEESNIVIVKRKDESYKYPRSPFYLAIIGFVIIIVITFFM